MLLQMALLRSCLWLSNIPLYIGTPSSLFIPLLMDISFPSMSQLLWIVLQWTLGCLYLSELWFCLDICPGVGLLDHMATLFLVFWGTSILFSIVAAPIYIPPTVWEGLGSFLIEVNASLPWSSSLTHHLTSWCRIHMGISTEALTVQGGSRRCSPGSLIFWTWPCLMALRHLLCFGLTPPSPNS